MIDIDSLPLFSRVVLTVGFLLAIMSYLLCLRYVVMLFMMKYSPEYREYIRKRLKKGKKI